ncbi:acyltransferase [Cellvibrio sp. UBA7661]|uniref:acyltransferase family protein n=1 Tax=Cellvibrio sp. UBA7661 TaxID=1946311 RepID=UPI002F3525D7
MNKREDSIDYLMVLRALSAVAVVFCHLPFQASEFLHFPETEWINAFFNPFGYIPVLIFFSLSGYLISLGFLTQRHDAHSVIGIKAYYRSRLFRIIPLYYFSIVVCVLVFWEAAEQHPWRVLSLFLFIENYKPMDGIVFNHVYWTMPVEMLYFLCAPFALIAIKWFSERYGDIACFLVVLIISMAISHYSFSGFEKNSEGVLASRREWNYFARFDFFYNLPAFLLGGAGALVVNNPKYRIFFEDNRMLIKVITVSSFIAITIYCSSIGLNQMSGGLINYFIAYALILSMALIVLGVAIIGVTQKTHQKRKLKILKPVEYLGVLAYGVYLFHMPAFDVVSRMITAFKINITNEWLTLLVLLITIGFSQLAYCYVEQPFLRRR